MNLFIFCSYFWLSMITFTSSVPIWIKNMTINFGQIMHTTSNSTSTTLWIVKNGQVNLTPCLLNFEYQYCTPINLPTTLHYSKISQVRQKFYNDINMTAYVFGGSSGEMCFIYPSSTRCYRIFQFQNPINIRINFGAMSQVFFVSVSFVASHSYIYKYIVDEINLYGNEVFQNIDLQDVDLFQKGQILQLFSIDVRNGANILLLQPMIEDNNVLIGYNFPMGADNTYIPQYVNTSYYMKQYDYMAYVYSFAGLFIFEFSDQYHPQLLDYQLLTFEIYDIQVIVDNGIGYIVSNQGLLEYRIQSRISESIPLNTNNPQKTIVKIVGGIDALMVIQKGTNKIQFYQYRNFQNDLKLLFIKEKPQQQVKQLSNFQKICIKSEYSGCQQFCENSCLSCSNIATNCSKCKPFYILNNEMNCIEPPINTFFKFSVSIISLYRPQKIQQLFFFVNNFNNYNYHKTNYSGYFKDLLMFVDSVQDQIWNLLPFDNVKNWIQQRIPIQTYTPYTSQKYQEMQRSDSMFLQNTKQFFVVYFLVTIVSFILLNRLFYLISHLEISKYIRVYSFWLYALFLIILQNWQQLLIISLSHLFNIFCFNFQTKMIQIVSLFLISMIIISCIVIFPMFYYFYDKKSTYFLSNINFSSYSWIIMAVQFVLVSGIQTAIHICLTEHPGIQKILLTANGIFFNFAFFFLYMKYNIFTSQGTFWIELILRSLLSLLNFVLYFRYDYIHFEEIRNAVETLIETILYCFMVFLCFECIYPLINLLTMKIMMKIKSENVQIINIFDNQNQSNLTIPK